MKLRLRPEDFKLCCTCGPDCCSIEHIDFDALAAHVNRMIEEFEGKLERVYADRVDFKAGVWWRQESAHGRDTHTALLYGVEEIGLGRGRKNEAEANY